jgi:hypothetical protein
MNPDFPKLFLREISLIAHFPSPPNRLICENSKRKSSMKTPRGKTGPTTSRGKSISSRNASKHNCTSQRLIVEGESLADFNALLESLTSEFHPETEMQEITVRQAARAAWDLARVNREFDKSQQKLYRECPDMRAWNTAQQAEFERMLRYRTKAERAYYRAGEAVEYLRKRRLHTAERAYWENLQNEKLGISKERLKLSAVRVRQTSAREANEPKEARGGTGRPAPWPAPLVHLSQLIEVRISEGVTSIRVHPLAHEMHQHAASAAPGAQVIRRFEFPDGVPAEYAWVNEPDMRRSGIVWTQHFASVEAWRAHVDWEAAAANGGFLPARTPRETPKKPA